jgi:hypothetical protein
MQADILHWLIENGCPWDAGELCTSALESAAENVDVIPVFDYLLNAGALSAELLTSTLKKAGISGVLWLAQWLRQHGAEWPAVLYSYDAYEYAEGRTWRGEALAWARAEGCTAPTERLY